MSAFTVGHTESYDRLLATMPEDAVKLGPTDNLHGKGTSYPGGIIFENIGAVRAWLTKEGTAEVWAVYELAAEFKADSYKFASEDFFRLTRDAKILRKVS